MIIIVREAPRSAGGGSAAVARRRDARDGHARGQPAV